VVRVHGGALGNSTRGLMGGGFLSSGISNVIDYVTIASAGNATDFGNLAEAKASNSGVSSPIRGVFGGGENASVKLNVMEYVTIASTGNSTDFGDLSGVRRFLGGTSNGHGGIA